MKINLKIIQQAFVHAETACDTLREKELVSNMMLRRRMTRNAKIARFLATEVGYSDEQIVFGTAYGEVEATVNIVESIYRQEALSPTAFQNSVHNTAASYLSMITGSTREIVTVSDLHKTSLSVLKTGAVKALKGDRWLLLNVDAFYFPHVNDMNQCGTDQYESGIALMVEATSEAPNIFIENTEYPGITPSLWQMLEVYHKASTIQSPVVEVEL